MNHVFVRVHWVDVCELCFPLICRSQAKTVNKNQRITVRAFDLLYKSQKKLPVSTNTALWMPFFLFQIIFYDSHPHYALECAFVTEAPLHATSFLMFISPLFSHSFVLLRIQLTLHRTFATFAVCSRPFLRCPPFRLHFFMSPIHCSSSSRFVCHYLPNRSGPRQIVCKTQSSTPRRGCLSLCAHLMQKWNSFVSLAR